MTTFLFSYRIPKNAVPAHDADAAAAWKAWFDSMGDSVVERGNPTFESTTLGNCGPDTVLGGYSIIDADDLDSAVVLAKGCPALPRGAGVEVGVITVLDDDGIPASD